VIGELKRLLRTYESLEKAARIIEVVADAETSEKKLLENISKLTKQNDQAASELDDLQSELSEVKDSILTAKSEAKLLVSDAKNDAQKILSEAKSKADTIVNEAEHLVVSMEDSIQDNIAKAAAAKAEAVKAEKELESLRNSIKEEKKRIIESLT